jgi:hypothetical protein
MQAASKDAQQSTASTSTNSKDSNKHAVKSVPANASKLKSSLKAEIKSADRQLRSSHTTIHYSLGDQPKTPSAPLEVADDISLKSPATTVLFDAASTAVVPASHRTD